MSVDPIEIPDDLESLRALVRHQQEQLDEHRGELEVLREYIRLLKHHRFGRKSEQHDDLQLWMFDEAEATCDTLATDAEEETVAIEGHVRKKRGRKPLPDSILRVEILHDLPESEKRCPADGSALERIGEEVSEQLEFIPAELRVLQYVRPKYACPTCRTGVAIAPMPAQPIPKSLASPVLLAHVAVSKYADGLPLYRQEQMFQRLGIDLPRATFANWMMKAGELVQPLMNLLREDLLASGCVQCDETPFQVLKEPGKAATSKSYLWVQRSIATDDAVVLFEYDPTRSAEVPKRLFAGFEGYLQTDGDEGYAAIGHEPGITHVGCWVHCRRKFDEALKSQGKSKKKSRSAKESKARQGLAFIQKLYRIERQMAEKPPDERYRLRQEKSKPVIEEMRAWLTDAMTRVPPKSLSGKALAYADGQWPKLERVLEDGRLPLDTNGVENAIRPFVIGRKNWLFAATVRGAQASANLYSVIETAKANGIEPFVYLCHVFRELPSAKTLTDIEALLPRNIDREVLQNASPIRRVVDVHP